MTQQIRIRCFMHVPYEGPGIIGNWIQEKNHRIDYTRLYDEDVLPDESEVDMLVIMGGPMNVFDFHIHPWMEDEINWVSELIATGKPVLGICLGAQIIASALGADVYPGKEKEIGWHNLRFLPSLGEFRIWKNLPAARKVFHWHGDTFHIPEEAICIASSQAFLNQGFIYKNSVIALQFHLEVTPESVSGMVENCRDELISGPFVQSEQEILAEQNRYKVNQDLMFQLLDYLSAQIS